jgi:putative addiction module component (TIGR02574 family)
MNAIDLATVDNLAPEEKLELLERLWASLVRTPAQVPVTQSQLQLLRKRLAEHEADPSDSIGLAEALDAARAKLR